MSGKDSKDSDPRRSPPGRDPRSDPRQTRSSHDRPSRDEDHNPAVYNPPGTAPRFQADPPRPLYNPVLPVQYPQYPPRHIAAQAFPPPRAPSHLYPAVISPYAQPVQPQPPALWAPPSSSLSNTGSGNIEIKSCDDSYKEDSTRMDHRLDAKIAASVSQTQTVLIEIPHLSRS